jgi:hypothetical protein
VTSPLRTPPPRCIQYVWFFVMNFVYVWLLIGFGSLTRLAFFTKTSYSLQFVSWVLLGL